jgi:hypothetical protein
VPLHPGARGTFKKKVVIWMMRIYRTKSFQSAPNLGCFLKYWFDNKRAGGKLKRDTSFKKINNKNVK